MKYLLLGFIAAACFCGISFAQEYDAKGSASPEYNVKNRPEKEVKGMDILVVYYSRTGNTRKAAEAIAEKLDADIEEIADKKDRSGAMGYMKAAKDAARENITEIEETKIDPSKYKIVIIGTPIWAWNMAPAVRKYILDNKENFANLAFYTTSKGTKPEKVIKKMEEVSGKKALASFGLFEKEIKKDKNKEVFDGKVSGFADDVKKALLKL
jgi:flavodoxin